MGIKIFAFTRKGKAEKDMQNMIFKSSVGLMRRIRRLMKKEKLHKKREHEDEHNIHWGEEIYNDDVIRDGFLRFLGEFMKEEEDLVQMTKYGNTQAFRTEHLMEDFLKELEGLSQKYPDLRNLITELHGYIAQIRSIIQNQKKKSRDLVRENERMRDKKVLPFMMIYHKIRAAAKDGRHDVRHVNKVKDDIEDIIHHLQGKDVNPDVARKNIGKLNKYFRDEEKTILHEFNDLALIDEFLRVLTFRSERDFKQLWEVLEKLKTQDFEKEYLEQLEQGFNEAYQQAEKWHREEYDAERVLKTTARKIA